MLMPILTVKAAIPAAAQATAAVESITPKEGVSATSTQISGNQSDIVLKILETLNRHLIGSEPLPKEALVRLLDTLARILKFPPLPQETLRDFSKRLAVYLETLPPAARLTLEKQLGQQNLAVSVRILADVLKNPVMIDAPRPLDRLFLPAANARPAATSQAEQRAAQAGVPRDQLPVPFRQGPLPTNSFLSLPPTTMADPGLLQAALKKAFGNEDGGALENIEKDNEDEPVIGLRKDDALPKIPARNASNPVAAAQSQSFARANPDSIPLLRAAAAFLAADPEALSQVVAIVAGEIDSQLKTELEQELGLDLSEPPDLPIPVKEQPQADRLLFEAAEEPKAQLRTQADATAALGSPKQTALDADGKVAAGGASLANDTSTTNIRKSLNEVEGFTGHDLGEWQLEPDVYSFVGTQETNTFFQETWIEKPQQELADTLNALMEASVPLPEGSAEGVSDGLFSALAGDTADMEAQVLFAELDTADGPLADLALRTGDIGDRPGLAARDDDGWTTLIDSPPDKAAVRQTFAHPAATDDAVREAQLPRQTEAGIIRDGIPFAMIPYFPAKTQETTSKRVEEKEEPTFVGDEQQHEREKSGDSHGDEDTHTDAETQEEADEDATDADTAYDLYRRMGGLG